MAGYQAFIHHYGYIALFVSMFINTTFMVVVGGIGSHVGYISLWKTIAVCTIGSEFFAQIYFFIGRRGASRLIARHEHWQAKMNHINTKVENHHKGFILSYRFIPGVRFVSPFIIGMSHVKWHWFTMIDICGAFLWSLVFAVLGYLLGAAMELILKNIEHYDVPAIIIAVVIGSLIWWWRHKRRMRRALGSEK